MAIYRGPGGSGDATTDATNQASVASDAASAASASQIAAANSATNAATSASTATTQASNASTSASNAATSETNAATSASNAATSYDNFDDRYLGSKSSAPSVDNDGNALLTGALYWNSTSNTMNVWTGSAWTGLGGSSGVSSFNTRTGAVTLSSSDVTTALTYTPVPPNGTGATGTWNIDVSGSAGTVTNGVVTSGSYANPSWITSLSETKVLPSQTGNSGKYLTTNGTSTSWATVTGGSMVYPGAGIAVSTGTAWGTSLTDNSSNWNTAYTDRLKWDGGSTGLTASTGRTSLGATTVGSNLFTLTNPSAVTFPRFNADNTVSALDASTFRTAIGAGTSSTTGTVTSVAALTLGTTGTDLTSTVATGTTTPVITLNVPTASATNRGVLSSADWSTFNGKGSGTVTSVSVVSANGFAGTVATATTTPSITLTTSITGLLKGNGTAISAAASGTDYAPATSGSSILYGNGSGGFSNVTVGSGLAFVAGTLSASGGGSMTYPTGSGIAVVVSGSSWGTTLIAPSGTIVGTTDTQTLTNKRITPRVSTTTSSATPTINTDNTDQFGLTAQTVDITSFTTNLSGTPTDGQKLWIYIVGTAARAITWGASFESSTATLPTTTVSTNRLDVGFVWNAATSKWRCVAVA
jgi:hypothetical protein